MDIATVSVLVILRINGSEIIILREKKLHSPLTICQERWKGDQGDIEKVIKIYPISKH